MAVDQSQMTIGLLSAALYMGLQMFVKPYRSYRSQMLADGLMLMLLLFLLLGACIPWAGSMIVRRGAAQHPPSTPLVVLRHRC